MANKEKKTRYLIICESPNKVKSISQLLKGTEFEGAIVQASVGHISEIKDGGSYWNTGIEPLDGFKTNYVVSADKKDVVQKLKEQVAIADVVYLCADPDREGEAIAWSLKKFLHIPTAKCRRAVFHEITKKAVVDALSNPIKIDDDLVDAAHARQQLDKMLGYRLSPIARRSIGAKSVGRCQSAGLKLLVDRENSILAFEPKEYSDLYLNFNKNNVVFKAKYFGSPKEQKQPSHDACMKVVGDCTASTSKGEWFEITKIETKQRMSSPKPPFTTSTFQQEVSSKLGVGVKTSMNFAQRLFEGIDLNGQHVALITYIRTDSTTLSDEFIPQLEKHVKSNYGKEYFSPLRKAKKSENAQEGHEAIRPVDLSMTPEKLSKYIYDKTLLKVYEIIYKRTVATMMSDSITNETIYTISCGKHIFTMSSKELEFDGYQKVYNYKEQDDESVVKESFKMNETIDSKYSPNLEITDKKTLPPARYKEATFIKELESSGIGRPSTFATIVNTITDPVRGYCTIEDKCLVPTEKGMKLSKFLDDAFPNLINLDYTSELEKSLDKISSGKLSQGDFMKQFYEILEESAKNARTSQKQTSKTKPAIAEGVTCPDCGGPMVLRKGPYGEFYGCKSYPRCKGIVKK